MPKRKKISVAVGPTVIKRPDESFIDSSGNRHQFSGNIHISKKRNPHLRIDVGTFAMAVPGELIVEFVEGFKEPGSEDYVTYRNNLRPGLSMYAEYRNVPDYNDLMRKTEFEPFICAKTYDELMLTLRKVTERIAAVRVAGTSPVEKVILIEAMSGRAPGAFCGVNSKGYLGEWKPQRPRSNGPEESLNGMPFLGMLIRHTVAYKHNGNFYFNEDLTGGRTIQDNRSSGLKYLEVPWTHELEEYMAKFVNAMDAFGDTLFEHLKNIDKLEALEAPDFKKIGR